MNRVHIIYDNRSVYSCLGLTYLELVLQPNEVIPMNPKNFALTLLATLLSVVANASSPAEHAIRLARCQQVVDVYNRCDARAVLNVEANRVELPSLGRSVPCDDGLELPFLERLKNPDIASMLSQTYPIGPTALPIKQVDFSPGGIRSQDFMMAVYGASRAEVSSQLVDVNFLGQRIKFTKLNGAAAALSAVGQDLMKLYRENTDAKLIKYLKPYVEGPCRGEARCNLQNDTFVWRLVAGTKTLSNHSFGTAIDMQPSNGTEYWVWDLRQMVHEGRAVWKENSARTDLHDILNYEPLTNADYPSKVVEAFEKHGFIWGGKWYRYDIMHFEFRPEFFPALKLACGAK